MPLNKNLCALKKYISTYCFSLLSLIFLNTVHANTTPQIPRLTIIIVVDQLSYKTMQKHEQYLNFGLKTLLTHGVNYTNAYHPHALPSTAVGHAALSTGTYPKDHGIISNTWFDEHNNPVHASQDTQEQAAVFSPTGTYEYGISSHLLMVDTLADQFMLQSNPNRPCYAYAISMKDRAATQMAGKLGKAIWFDEHIGHFTSSKAYFETLPLWIKNFNNHKAVDQLTFISWLPAYPITSNIYNCAYQQSFEYADFKEGLFNTQIPIEWNNKPQHSFSLFKQTPQANHLIFDLAKTCIDEHINKHNNNHLLLWVSLSPLDWAGHAFGPDSNETIDIIYHLDKQLADFMEYAHNAVQEKEILFVLTADHGTSPIVETVAQKGIPARRYIIKDIIHDINQHLAATLNINNLITNYVGTQFYIDTFAFNKLDQTTQQNIIKEIKCFLRKQPGVKEVWTFQELKQRTYFEPYTLESYYKNQLYLGRSGQIIVQTRPYYDITTPKTGADHTSPYNYNTHVPLILYQPGLIEGKTVRQRVLTIQLANTLADILHIPKPSASICECLPGIER